MAIHLPERIHVVFKTHLDLGYTELAQNVVEQYFASHISPREAVSRGNRSLYAVDQNITYQENEGICTIETLDAPLIAPGNPLLDFSDTQLDLSGGRHCNLYNNIWGTNFPMSYEEDARFRFS